MKYFPFSSINFLPYLFQIFQLESGNWVFKSKKFSDSSKFSTQSLKLENQLLQLKWVRKKKKELEEDSPNSISRSR
ncbi:MAG: hypothetical protein C6I01_02305 [Epsilonproteobacteria bacterium]|nr:hypothetical protein [Campylobacterota bacterium]